ncbi:MAG: [FeFe] hydrogenase H-cluster maturation GTPase HydF [Lentisphaeria bacterium]
MQKTPKSLRLHIALFGRRNVGKSSVLNAITRQETSIVSDVAGTTTDPVEKPMELLPIGPVVFIDTAGLDDIGSLGGLRTERTHQVFDRADIGIIVTEAGHWEEYEEKILAELRRRDIPAIVIFNKFDLAKPRDDIADRLNELQIAQVNMAAHRKEGVEELREALVKIVPEEFITPPSILNDLVPPGEMAVLVVPIDLEAPKGRLILPQVQAIRELLDNDAYCMVVKARELRDALDRLKRPPALVITDSQAFEKVSADTPPEIPLTSFSIVFARIKGDLQEFERGARAINDLQAGDRILIAEACTHHPIGEDIGTVKIPRWLQQYVGGKLEIDHVQGRDFPTDLSPYKLVIHCAACVWNRRSVLSRIVHCREAGVPITNYGITIAYTLGILDRALTPFTELKESKD